MPAFGPLSALFREADHPRADDVEVAWYAAHIPADALALDVMCGWGRVLVPLAERGCNVHGVDASAAMLARCDARAATANARAPTFRQEVSQLNLPLRYGHAFIADGAFGLLTDPMVAAAALERIRAHLVDPGALYIDCRIPPAAVQRLGAPLVEVRTVKLDDGTQIALRSESMWTAEAQMAHAANRYAHRRGAARLAEEHERIASTWYEPEAIVELVRAAGFRDVSTAAAAVTPVEGDAFVVIAQA